MPSSYYHPVRGVNDSEAFDERRRVHSTFQRKREKWGGIWRGGRMPRGSAWVRPQLTSRENRAAPSSAPALQSCPSAAAAGISEAPGIGDRAERP